MISNARRELLKVQKRLYNINRRIIEASIEVKDPDFIQYERHYKKHIAEYRAIVSHDEMLKKVEKASLVYVGDYHTSNQSQRSFLRILKALIRDTSNFAIGMELIHTRYQHLLDAYMKGNLTEETFLKKISLKQHWVFDLWPNFKPLFDFAKYHGIKIYAIDAAGQDATLRERDKATGKLVAQLLLKHPERKLFVMIGDLHLAPKHLPKEVEKSLKNLRLVEEEASLDPVVLYQNSDAIFWKLASKGQEEQVEVVEIDDNCYCRMHTPPIVVQQSYINWLEHEEGEIDYADAKHSFLTLVDRIDEFFEIDLGSSRDKVEVFTCGDLSFLKTLKESGRFTPQELRIIKRQVMSSESYYIAKKHFVYLANLSLNHAAEEAAHFIKHLCSGLERPRTQQDAFYANILHEALAFCASKLINSKRKCAHEGELEALVKYLKAAGVPKDRKSEYKAASFVLNCLKNEKTRKPCCVHKVIDADLDLFFAATHAIGYMLGDTMFYALMKNVIKRDHIREMFFDPWRGEGRSFEVYMELKKRLRGVKIPKRM